MSSEGAGRSWGEIADLVPEMVLSPALDQQNHLILRKLLK